MPQRSTAVGSSLAELNSRRWQWQVSVPAWLVSLVAHALMVLAMGYVASQQMHGTRAPASAVLIASAVSAADEENYFDDERTTPVMGVAQADPSDPDPDPAPDEPAEAAQRGLAEIAQAPPPVDVDAHLPSTELASVQAGQAMQGTPTGINQFPGVARRPPAVRGLRAKTHIYGLPGEGNSFVYVFDRSSSMGIGANSLLASAKRELLASLDELGPENQFQIIFYNQQPVQMDLGRAFAGLVFAEERSKELARRFVGGILANGSTDHYPAFMKALRLSPDVIFFLTDADEPELSAVKIAKIRNANGGRTSINTIEFGEGPQPRHENFLARIARENGGRYIYINVRGGAISAVGRP